MLRVDSASRLVAELQGALEISAERQRQLEESLRVSRRLLRAWAPVRTTALEPLSGPESKKEDSSPACTSSPQELKELELLTQALEKATQVRKGISKTGERNRIPSQKSGSTATSPGTTASALPQASSQVGHTRRTKGIHQTTVPAKHHPEHRLPLVRDRSHVPIAAQAIRLEPSHRKQMTLAAAPHAVETFTLKQKGTLLQLPMAFRKAASQNACLWNQLNSTQTSDATEAASAAKTQFLQKMQMASGISSPRFTGVEVEKEVQCLQKACALLRLRMQKELSAAPADWMQEYRSLLTLEGLQTLARQCLHKLQELCAALTEQFPGPYLMERPLQVSLPCDGQVSNSWGPQLLLYSSTQELQTLATLRLRVAMLEQWIHLEKVLMAELLPVVSSQESQGPSWLALCRAAHSLLCEGGERFLTILQEDPAD